MGQLVEYKEANLRFAMALLVDRRTIRPWLTYNAGPLAYNLE